MYHNPVLLHKSIEGLNLKDGGTYVDATFGGGGHARHILERLHGGRLIAFDQDMDAMANIPEDDRFMLVNQNFRFLKNFLRLYDALPVDGILADLGVSSHQFDVPDRGFSTRFDAPLDMRMNKAQSLHAADIINNYSIEDLSRLFTEYGELKNSYKVARTIVETRSGSPITTTAQLVNTIENCFQPNKRNKFLAMVFQALRIEVNEELDVLKDFLEQCLEVLKPGGRLVVISYHSLEDRLVKNFIKTGNFKGELHKDFYGNPIVGFKQISGKPIVADAREVDQNNRARSAKMRIAEKLSSNEGE